MNIRFTPIAMAVALALHSPLLFSLDRQSAVEKLKDLTENSPSEVDWQDTDRTATSDFVKLARAIHVDTRVDLRSFNEGEIYPEEIIEDKKAAGGFRVTTEFSPNKEYPDRYDFERFFYDLHGTEMARILLNTAQHGQIYAVQRLGLTDSDWRRRLPATKAANEQLKAQTKEYAPVIAHIWNEEIADRDLESPYLKYIEEKWLKYSNKVAEIAQQGSLQLFATGNDHTQYPDNPYTSVLALLDFNNYTSLRTDLKDKVKQSAT
ncbi:hypothetical protein [Avibacterium avium]|uniref:hypothetical protein n=1 Tax=Avibacterium avium TaxID=751 RepID=UPI003BF77567